MMQEIVRLLPLQHIKLNIIILVIVTNADVLDVTAVLQQDVRVIMLEVVVALMGEVVGLLLLLVIVIVGINVMGTLEAMKQTIVIQLVAALLIIVAVTSVDVQVVILVGAIRAILEY